MINAFSVIGSLLRALPHASCQPAAEAATVVAPPLAPLARGVPPICSNSSGTAPPHGHNSSSTRTILATSAGSGPPFFRISPFDPHSTMMLPIPNFPWFAAAAAAAAAASASLPWRPNLDSNAWHQILAASRKEEGADNSSDGTDCVVCGDKSSGKHYGQFSCEGCKSFFKRSIRRSLSYTCRATKNCAIDVQHRNQCQYCRLTKCIRMGMRKEAVQRGRLPVQMPPFFPSNPFFRPPFPLLPFNPMMAAQFAKNSMKESIFEFAAQTIFATVNWARSSMINLTRADQLILLRHSWTPIFVFALAHSNFAPNLANHLMENGGMKSEDEEKMRVESVLDEPPFQGFQSKLDEIRELHLDIVEISSLRAILLFSCDEESQLEEKNKIDEIVEKLTSALEEYCKMNKTTERFNHLCSCLQLLKSIRSLPISRLFFSRLLGSTPLESILSDLLSTPNPTIPTPPSLPLIPQFPTRI